VLKIELTEGLIGSSYRDTPSSSWAQLKDLRGNGIEGESRLRGC